MIGTTQPFYGVDDKRFKLGEHIFEAVEDESDGYRSYLGAIKYVDPQRPIFFEHPLANVVVHEYENEPDDFYGTSEGFRLVDASGHVWLRVGTDNVDDYYPVFRFEYTPREVQV